ncbi:PE-PPE domain-containing protein [Mycobacterium sp. CVI_P3]|uniref:PE-PPE domain-containing protein n=1 Tax=Mycobacterium pinniadriaticum TaxID=2994102 RepID=A0ABT3SEB6_9MYCO|nr:PE-PPE domain-containing protein [Mycobacterium pinniadriaticum]MCX2931427.1 PE-PPE domain-containing protein [Mycobacterium pinniadriaticum]MCX2937851.1 PE-PPE domain-containing protein [Mycobacterium pinniadriaticum]
MGGTGHPLSTPPDTVTFIEQYLADAVDRFVSPASDRQGGIPSGPYNTVAAITPEDDDDVDESVAEGVAALHSCITSTICDYNQDVGSLPPSVTDTFIVFGYSQSAGIAMAEKSALAAMYAPGEGPDVSFVVIGNARPNGGLAMRDTAGIITHLLFGTPINETDPTPPPTDTQYATVDIATQYDGLADNMLNPLNLLAALNAYVGLEQHVTYDARSLTQPAVVDQGQYGDTHYYLISTPILPLLVPLETFGPMGHALADALDAPLRVIIESAYDRTVSPGVPTAWDTTYFPDPTAFARNLIISIPTGLDNGIEDLTGARPFGTARPGPLRCRRPRCHLHRSRHRDGGARHHAGTSAFGRSRSTGRSIERFGCSTGNQLSTSTSPIATW